MRAGWLHAWLSGSPGRGFKTKQCSAGRGLMGRGVLQSDSGVVKVDFETPEKGTRDLLYVDGDMQISIDHRGFIAVAVRNT